MRNEGVSSSWEVDECEESSIPAARASTVTGKGGMEDEPR